MARTAAKHRAIDLLRRERMLARKHQDLSYEFELDQLRDTDKLAAGAEAHIEDDLLRLIFIACHPLLSTDARTALTLRLQSEDVVEAEIREYLMKRVRPLPEPKSAAEWTADEKRLRKHLLENVIFHGWPKEWVDSPPKFDDLGLIPSGKGYRLRKLRYEIVPGFLTTALLREPENPRGKCRATINVNGHDPSGKAAKYVQKHSINNALQARYA